MHNMEEDSFMGTCLMQDGRYVTLSWQQLDKAFKKVMEYDYVIPPALKILLQDLYNNAMADVLALEDQIEISECTYQQMMATASHERDAKRAARKSSKNVRPATFVLGTPDDSGMFGTEGTYPKGGQDISSDNDHALLQKAAILEDVKVVDPREPSRKSRRNILSLTKKQPLYNVDNEVEDAKRVPKKDVSEHEGFDAGEQTVKEGKKPDETNEDQPGTKKDGKDHMTAEIPNHDPLEDATPGANKDSFESQLVTKTDGAEDKTGETANHDTFEDATPGANKDGTAEKGIDDGEHTIEEGLKWYGTDAHKNEDASMPGAKKDGAEHLPAQITVEDPATCGKKDNDKLECIDGLPQIARDGSNTDGDKEKGIDDGEQTADEDANKDGQEQRMAEGENPYKLEDVNVGAVKDTHGINKRSKRVTPTAMYTQGQTRLKRALFPCPICDVPANGSHQCGYCFAHVHALCALPYEGSSDGSAQRMDCGMCGDGYGEEESTQPWVEDNDQHESLVMTTSITDAAASKQELTKKRKRKKSARKYGSIESEKDNTGPNVVETTSVDLKSVEGENEERLEAARFIASLYPSGPSDDATRTKSHRKNRKKRKTKKALRVKNVRELLDDITAGIAAKTAQEVAPHATELNWRPEPPDTMPAQTEGFDPWYNEEYDDTKPEEWYWDNDYETWVHIGPKRVRRKNLSNRMEKNWVLGMRRNWETDKKAKMIAKMTITRDNIDAVSPLYSHHTNKIIQTKPVFT